MKPISVFIIIFMGWLSACSKPADQTTFSVRDVSCVPVQVSTEVTENLKRFMRYKGRDTEETHNELYEILRKIASFGNTKGMAEYGFMLHEKALMPVYALFTAHVPVPESEKSVMIRGLTYMYLAEAIDPEHRIHESRHPLREVMKSIENDKKYIIPHAWFNEARANRDAWLAFCGRSSDQ